MDYMAPKIKPFPLFFKLSSLKKTVRFIPIAQSRTMTVRSYVAEYLANRWTD